MSRVGQVWERKLDYDWRVSNLYLVVGEGNRELTLLNLETGQTCHATYKLARMCSHETSEFTPILDGQYTTWKRIA